MPIYEYYCQDCNVVFSFMSTEVDPSLRPRCPRCSSHSMKKHLSSFNSPSKSLKGKEAFDEQKIEGAFDNLLYSAEKLTEDDADGVAHIVESFTRECGLEYSQTMKETLGNISASCRQEGKIDPEALLVAIKAGTTLQEKGNAEIKKTPPEIDSKIYQL